MPSLCNFFLRHYGQIYVCCAAVKPDAGQCGSHLCCQIKNACDVCNGKKDKPQQLRLRWVGYGGGPRSIDFSSKDLCVKQTTLTSDSDSNEVVLDAASCLGSGRKLPTNIQFQVDGSTTYLHASCSQALNVGDVVYTDNSKGFLILVGFRAMSGRTDGSCSGTRPQSNSNCDVCNGKDDKPQKIRLRWEGNAGVPSAIKFSSYSTCVEELSLTSDSNTNEVVLDAASCFGPGSNLPSNVYFKVDDSATYLHTSCSKALNVGDVIYMDKNKGSLILVGFQAMSGRTDRVCSSGPVNPPSQDQCTCDDAEQCFGDVLYHMRKKNYRLDCEPVKPKICEALTRVDISPEDCSASAQGCSHSKGFKIVMCPCSEQCFDGKSCQSSECPCNSIDCSDWLSRKASLLDFIKKDECVCTGDTPCLTDYTAPKCDVCDLRKDKPQTLIFRWIGKARAQTSIKFQSEGTCVKETTLTSGSKSNEVALDASCFDSGSKLPTNIYFKVDGATTYLHASCSQPLNVGDVVYKHQSKGSLILVGFRSVSGRTESDCPKGTYECGPRSVTPPSLSCGAGIELKNDKSTKGVSLSLNSDFSVQYMWSQTRGAISSSWTDQFEYTALSCDGEKVRGKVIVNVRTPRAIIRQETSSTKERSWGDTRSNVQCDRHAGEVLIKSSSKKVSSIESCKESCEDVTGCQSITFFNNGYCTLFSTPCTKTRENDKTRSAVLLRGSEPMNSNLNVVASAQEIERHVDLSSLCKGKNILWFCCIIGIFNVFLF